MFMNLRFPRIFRLLIIGIVIIPVLLQLSCGEVEDVGGEIHFLEYRSSKLQLVSEDILPEALFSYDRDIITPMDKFYDSISGEYTIAKDTRRVVMMGEHTRLTTWVDHPGYELLRFSCGLNEDAFKYGKELTLQVSYIPFGKDKEEIEIGEVSLNTRNKEDTAGWKDIEWVLPESSWSDRLIFALDGIADGAPADAFLLAHPTLVNKENALPLTRIIWIGVDTLRADHLGCYGYQRPTSPHIDRFATENTLFKRCISTSPWTFPSFASMLTGKYPSTAGAVTNVKYLPDEELTIAEWLNKINFATMSIVNSHWVSKMTNLHQGFAVSKRFSESEASVSFDAALEWLNAHSGENAFVFIHLMDCHRPYHPKPEYLGKFGANDYSGQFTEEFMVMPEVIEEIRAGNVTLPEEDWNQIEALYDEEIVGLDQDFGAFIKGLKAAGIYDDTMIIFTADHGEEFREHGGYEHGHSLYDEVIHVPLIIKDKMFRPGERIDSLCSTIDIFPTLMAKLYLTIPSDINGLNLLSLAEKYEEPDERYLLSEQLYYGVEQKGVSTDQYRYILHTEDGSEELYDFDEDPEMLDSVADDRRAASRDLRYFAKEFTLNGESGWHMRFGHPKGDEFGKNYHVEITAPGGFTDIVMHGFEDADSLIEEDGSLVVDVHIEFQGEKMLAFSTPDEDVELLFTVEIDGGNEHSDLIYIGASKTPFPYNEFSLKITNEHFGLGIPNFQQGKDPGLYIWGNSLSLRDELTPEIGDQAREELRTLGYLQ